MADSSEMWLAPDTGTPGSGGLLTLSPGFFPKDAPLCVTSGT